MPAPRRLTVMVSLDVTGFTRLVHQDERATLAGIAAIRRDLIDTTLQHRNGHVFKTMGDGALIEFPNVEDAVSWTVEFQEAMSVRNLLYPEKPILVRAGIALGDVYVEGEDRFGAAIAAVVRLQEVAPPGGIAMTHSVRWQLGKALRARFTRVIETLRGFDEPWEIWIWTTSGDCGAFAAGSSRRIDRNENQLSIIPDKPSLAVLPFQNMSGDLEQDYFADGVVEDIIMALSRMRWLFVIARNSSFTYKGRAVDVKQVGRELGVRYVLEGRVRKAGARVRITGQLIDATTGGHIWAASTARSRTYSTCRTG
jgi:adenylate cyclase